MNESTAAPLHESDACCEHPAPSALAVVAADDRRVRRAVAAALADLGRDCFAVRDAEEALDVASRIASVDLVVIDLALAGSDPLQLVLQVKAFDRRLPVLVVSGGSHAEVRLHSALVRGADAGRALPCTHWQLMEAIESATGEGVASILEGEHLRA